MLDSKGGMVGKIVKCVHLRAMTKTVEFTGNVREELSSHDVTVTAYQNNPKDLL